MIVSILNRVLENTPEFHCRKEGDFGSLDVSPDPIPIMSDNSNVFEMEHLIRFHSKEGFSLLEPFKSTVEIL